MKKKLNVPDCPPGYSWDDQWPNESYDDYETRLNPVWTKENVQNARSGFKVFEELGLKAPRGRGRPTLSEAEKKKRVTIMLDQDVIAHFKKGGKGWQTRANAALRKAAGL